VGFLRARPIFKIRGCPDFNSAMTTTPQPKITGLLLDWYRWFA
jgi:hypothetical protein